MNQEEWLAERRRLGLPADPSKDFPPNYREDPAAIQNRFARPGGRQGQARAVPDPQAHRGTTSGGGPAPRGASRGGHGGPGTAPGPAGGAALPSAQQLLDAQRARLAEAARTVIQRPAQVARASAASPTPRPAPLRPGYPTPSGAGVRLPAGTRIKKKSNPLGTLIGVLVIGGIAVAGPLNSAFKSFTGSSHTSTQWDTGDDAYGSDDTYASGLDLSDLAAEDPDLAEQVTSLTEGFVAGKPAAIKALIQSEGTDLSTLTPASARAAMGADASFEVSHFTLDDTDAAVGGELTTGGGSVPMTLEFTRSNDAAAWAPRKLSLPSLRPASLPTAASAINGVPIDASKLKAAGRPVAVWPGRVSVQLAKDRYTSWGKNPVVTAATGGLRPERVSADVAVVVTGERTAAFKRDAFAAAMANYRRCLKLSDLTLKNCPFNVNAQGVTKPRNIRYTQTKAPGTLMLTGALGSERVVGQGGQVSLSGSGFYHGQPTALEGNLSVSFNGTVAVKGDKIVYTED